MLSNSESFLRKVVEGTQNSVNPIQKCLTVSKNVCIELLKDSRECVSIYERGGPCVFPEKVRILIIQIWYCYIF